MKLGGKVTGTPMKLGGKVSQSLMKFGKKMASVNTSLGGNHGAYDSGEEEGGMSSSGGKKTYYSLEKSMRHGKAGTMMV